VSRKSPSRHRKQQIAPDRTSRSARHRKPSPVSSALQHRPALIAAAVAGSTLIVSAAVPVAAHWPLLTHRPGADRARALSALGANDQVTGGAAQIRAQRSSRDGTSQSSRSAEAKLAATRLAAEQQAARRAAAQRAAAERATAQRAAAERAAAQRAAAERATRRAARRRHAQQQATATAVYRNPLRAVSGLIPERVDMGVDFGGSGPVYALGDAVITNATSDSAGWPGGGWITYRLTSGPAAGLMVYVAEDVTPTVQVGQTVNSGTVIANMFNGGDGIETGWAQPDGSSAESQLPEAGGISGGGPFPTMVGLNFEALLETLGVPAGSNAAQPGNGILPSNYPTSWTAATGTQG
jgi:murein DD-endopeptidase MepM/ murein hydrolase activator NlpD